MGLGIYSVASTDASNRSASVSGQLINPIVVAADGRSGATTQRKLWVRTNETGFMYSGISVRPINLTGTSVVDGTGGYSIKVSPGDAQPTESGWQRITAGNVALLSGVVIGSGNDTSTFAPFWTRVEVPRSTSIRNITDVRLRLSATKIINS